MKWLLITTLGKNPGDGLIRIGCERLVREVDADAVFDYLDKEDESTQVARPFDRAVVCGMPMFWHEDFTKSSDMPWWPLLTRGWPAQDRRRIMALGVGSCCSTLGRAYKASFFLEDAQRSMWSVVLRDNYIPESWSEVICCPGLFAIDAGAKSDHLVNLMPDGGHWPAFNQAEAATWASMYRELVSIFSGAGWKLVAHSSEVLDAAISAGWSGDYVLADTAEAMVAAYANAAVYFGNRVHGAIASLASGGQAVCVGYDSRIRAASRAGAITMRPSNLDLAQVAAPAGPGSTLSTVERQEFRVRMLEIIKQFAQ